MELNEAIEIVGRYVRSNPALLNKAIDELNNQNMESSLNPYESFQHAVVGQFYVLKADKKGYAFIKKDTQQVYYVKAYEEISSSFFDIIGLPCLIETSLIPFFGNIFMDIQCNPILVSSQIKNKEELKQILTHTKKKKTFIRNIY